MAKTNIVFNNANYTIDDATLSVPSDAIRSHLLTVMNGSGATMKFGGTTYNVDSSKLNNATGVLAAYLETVAGNGYQVVVNGTKYSVDASKMAVAVTNLESVLSRLQDGDIGGNGLPAIGISAEECTWEQINDICTYGKAQKYFKLGDTKVVPIDGYGDVVMEIVAFNEDVKADGSGRAAITWISKKPITKTKMNSSTTNVGGWEASSMRSFVNSLEGRLPADLQEFVVDVNKTYYDHATQSTKSCVDKVWIPSAGEIFGNDGISNGCEDSGAEYTRYFNLDSARIKYDSSNKAIEWWLRTASKISDENFHTVFTSGKSLVREASNYKNYYAVIGFCTGNGGFNEPEGATEPIPAGLYQAGSEYTVLLSDWNTLLTDGTVRVDNGVVYSNYDSNAKTNSSATILVGDLVLPIDGSVTEIGADAFRACGNLIRVRIPEGVTTIGSSAFYGCKQLIGADIPNTVVTLGEYAFYDCERLTKIIIPDSVVTIDRGVFWSCDSLLKVTIGNGVTSIGEYAFRYCSEIEAVYISDLEAWCNIQYDGYDSMPTNYMADLYLNGELLTDIVIPSGITTIEAGPFYGCTSMVSITIPDSVTTIGTYAFNDCDNLISVTIPGSVANIGNGAFYKCDNLTDVIIQDGVSVIDSSAFSACEKLESIVIPRSVTVINKSAFWQSNNLTTVYYAGSQEEWAQITIGASNDSLTNATIIYNYTGE